MSEANQETFLAQQLYLDSKFNFLEKLPSTENLQLIGFGLFLLFLTVKIIRYQKERGKARAIIAAKVRQVEITNESLENKFGDGKLVNDKQEEIIHLSVQKLLQKLHNGTLLCVEVLVAYQAKALKIHKEFNCVTEFIIEAEEWAAKLDSIDPSKRGPLHGLPFSIKDNIGISGYDSTVGISQYLNKPIQEDAALVAALKSLGAIPFCKTNVPQSMLSFGCSNPLWGCTKNPFCKSRTPGGSSGGESCLIGAGGAPFGIGSDIGGSVRIPAAFCGISSIKPTSSRLSYKGFRVSVKGVVGINAVPGIMARDTDTVILISKLLLDQGYLQKFDPTILPLPWNEQLFQIPRKLRIGYYEEDDFMPSTPGVRRAVRLARDHYEKLGHEMIPFSSSNIESLIKSYSDLMQADQAESLLRALSFDDVDPTLKLFVWSVKTPYFLKWIFSPLLSLFASRTKCFVLASGGHAIKKSSQLWKEVNKKNEYKEEFLSRWLSLELDLCIAPAFACPAPLNKDIGSLYAAGSYALPYSYMDFPVGVVPITQENECDQSELDNYDYFDVTCKRVRKTTTGAHGLPIGVQIVGLPYKEELVLHGMSLLDSVA